MEFQCIQCGVTVRPRTRQQFYDHHMLCDDCWAPFKPRRKPKPELEPKPEPKPSSITSRIRHEARTIVTATECQMCGAPRECVHHVVRVSDGGRNERDNLMPLCRLCHRKQHPDLPDCFFR